MNIEAKGQGYAGTLLPRSRPEQEGLASEGITHFLEEIERQKVELHSMMVLRHGKVVAEGWWKPYKAEQPHRLYSLSKSFTSTAIGLAVEEGKLSVGDRVLSFFPELANRLEMTPYLKQMTVHHLLTMSTGHAEESLRQEIRPKPEWLDIIFSKEIVYEPGTRFVYNSGATYVLSAIVQTVTGQTLVDYLRPRLFEPLGFAGYEWELSPEGCNTGGWGLSLTTEDIAKFGQLYLQQGVWEGTRLIPESWVNLAASKQIESGDPGNDSHWDQGYGYQFWRCKEGAYRADGAFGQFCVVLPKEDAVIVTTSAAMDAGLILDAVQTHLRGSMTEVQTEEEKDNPAYDRLQQMLQSLSLDPVDPPRGLFDSTLEKWISGRVYQLEENPLQLHKLLLTFGQMGTDLELYSPDGERVTIHMGRGVWVQNPKVLLGDSYQQIAASFTWEEERTLVITWRYVETPLCVTIQADFAGDQLLLQQSNNMSPEQVLVIKGKQED